MIKKVTKITVYHLSEKYEEHLKRLEKVKEIIHEIQDDEEMCDPNRNVRLCGYLSNILANCSDAQDEINAKFTEKKTERHEEIID